MRLPRMARPVTVLDVPAQTLVPVANAAATATATPTATVHTTAAKMTNNNKTTKVTMAKETTTTTSYSSAVVTATYLVDFGREFQGGLRLGASAGVAGAVVSITSGELLDSATGLVEDHHSWGYSFNWTLRGGDQVLEQHKYMECRFVSLEFYNGPAPRNFTLSAWKVHYPYDPADSAFTSSNATLNAVWELCRYTLEAASLDTYTDSNTRERRPYEADGIIAATGRLLTQRDVLWPRHSHAWVIQYPTWPVEVRGDSDTHRVGGHTHSLSVSLSLSLSHSLTHTHTSATTAQAPPEQAQLTTGFVAD
jgi:hypothetical protein